MTLYEPAYTYTAWILLEQRHSDGTVTAVNGFVDGDTLHVVWDLGRDVYVNETIRLYGINAPEMSTPEGKAARQHVIDWFQTHCPDNAFVLHSIKDRREKYGRYLGIVVSFDGFNLNDDMVSSGNAVPYFPK